jgi:predicted carbohydrate-binding protein with CBM48
MSDADHDPVLQRAIDELRQLPPLDRDAVRRVVGAAAAARLSPADEPVFVEHATRGRSIRMWSAIGMAAAAAVVGFIARGEFRSRDDSNPAAVASSAAQTSSSTTLQTAASSDADSKPILQQFVFDGPRARRVSVVGDFNTWNPTSAVMTRSAEGGLWSAIIPITPGRHIYGFMVDDSLFTLDPRAPKARDADLGTEGSVVIVGRP